MTSYPGKPVIFFMILPFLLLTLTGFKCSSNYSDIWDDISTDDLKIWDADYLDFIGTKDSDFILDYKDNSLGNELVTFDTFFSCSEDSLFGDVNLFNSVLPEIKLESNFDANNDISVSSGNISVRPYNYKEDLLDIRNEIVKRLNQQHPNYPNSICLRKFEIQNWPEGVEQSFMYWTKKEIQMIRERLDNLVFIYRGDNSSNLRENPAIDLLKRFRQESGYPLATRINWDMLNRDKLPEKYRNMNINSKTVLLNVNRRNPEIMENIHFNRYENLYFSNMMQNARSISSSRPVSESPCSPPPVKKANMEQIKQNLLERFRRESRNTNARHIEWKRVDITKLPKKYHDTRFSHATVFDFGGLYEEEEFIENLHFIEYTDKHLADLAKKVEKRKNRRVNEGETINSSLKSGYEATFSERQNKKLKI